MDLTMLLKATCELQASDLFLTAGAPPLVRLHGGTRPLPLPALTRTHLERMAREVMGPAQREEFARTMECNLGYTSEGGGRFRFNVYRQRGETAMVARRIADQVPALAQLGLPESAQALAMLPRGLVLVVGAAAAGKSTTMAAMVAHRARQRAGHILTIEDPIEYLHAHDKSMVDQREVGIDTLSFSHALANAMRQAPDMIAIGEIRDRDTMQHALAYASSGHLCLSTLHASNCSQAIQRVLGFFPESMRSQVLMDLSQCLHGVISQRLVRDRAGRQALASEVMLQSPFVASLIQKGAVDELKAAIAKGQAVGMNTFDQSLFELVRTGRIDRETALEQADSRADLGLRMKLEFAPSSAQLEHAELAVRL